MNEIRYDPLSGHRVLIAEGRADRPRDFDISHSVDSNLDCPFCAGNENQTPDEVLRANTPDTADGWAVRIVRNKFPALSLPSAPRHRKEDLALDRLSDASGSNANPTVRGEGLHEVIIESPEHHIRTTELGVTQLTTVLHTTANRLEQIRGLSEFQSVQIFKNDGPVAGATIAHTHSQLIALPMITPSLSRELTAMALHREQTQHCLLCEMQENEIRVGKRIVAENVAFTAFCAFAGRQPGETWIVPKTHQPDFSATPFDDCRLLAEILDQVLRQLDVALTVPAYNSMIHSAPLEGDFADHYHWRMVILPRITTQAGFEWGSGCFITPIAPERIANAMRHGVTEAIRANIQMTSRAS
ncbi:MAG: galactose-1-phosphate uridylyltransferase [Planctomycetaceae bacterium]|nr:galactose-1-phosphate uridylyltransferase [Planctomycetaceae bacterium]|tara:strand:+ start:17180 stop:18250 length:1071 start_codon:yes stop_codon:yes gene_type:complete